jgi:pyridoxine 5-phosphate synthase
MANTKLSVNINKIALLRNSRNMNLPNVVQFAEDCLRYGADGITIHPRPDERHIRKTDVYALRELFPRTNAEFNIEGYPSEEFMKLVLEIKPDQVTLVPDPPHVLTSSEGWNTIEQFSFLKGIIKTLQEEGMRVSLFMDTQIDLIEAAAGLQTDRIEFYTGSFSQEYDLGNMALIHEFVAASKKCEEWGLGINAGHDLNLKNLKYFKQHLPTLMEVSIGHALVSDCLYHGLENVIPMYKRLLDVSSNEVI